MHIAVRACRVPLVQPLLAAHANLEARNKAGFTPLHLAVAPNCLPVVKLLVESGADVKATDEKGQTALDLSRRRRVRDITSYLDQNKP